MRRDLTLAKLGAEELGYLHRVVAPCAEQDASTTTAAMQDVVVTGRVEPFAAGRAPRYADRRSATRSSRRRLSRARRFASTHDPAEPRASN
jgi:hypothetical protein